MANNEANPPLAPAVLQILLALSTQERHGYGTMKQIESDSQGKVRVGPGALYGVLCRMMKARFVRESEKKIDPQIDAERRAYFKITALGQHALVAELARCREAVEIACELHHFPQVMIARYARL
jgi:DNA-binding PadR family transcriptional regulator